MLLLLEWPVTTTVTIEQEEQVKSREEIMNMLEAFDLTGSFRDAGELAGCSHHTVAAYVAERDEGRLGGVGPVRRKRIIDPWLPKIEEWVERSCGKIRADRCHAKLKALGFEGSDRTVRRAVAEAKKSFAGGSAAGVSAVDPRAGDVGAVGTGERARSSPGGGRICFVRGWRGRGSGW